MELLRKFAKKIITSSLLKSAGVYTLTNIINSAIPFFMLPILTRYMTPTDYGYVAIFQVLISFVVPFTGLNIHGVIARKYFDEQIEMPMYIANCLVLMIISSLFVFIIFTSFSQFISQVTAFPVDWLWIVVCISFLGYINNIILTLWQVQNKAAIYGTYLISHTIVNVSLTILLVVVMNRSWHGQVESQFITAVIFGVLGFFLIYKNGWLRFRINKAYIFNALSFGVPLIPHALSGIVIMMTGRLFIVNNIGLAEAGLYTLGYQIAFIIALLGDSFIQAWVPWLYEKLKYGKFVDKCKIVKFTYYYFVLMILCAVVFSWVTPLFLKFFVGKDFIGASIYIFWIALGWAFSNMYKMVVAYIFFVEKTAYLSGVTLCSSVINIASTYYMTQTYGAVGAAQAFALTYFVFFILTWILSALLYKMPWLHMYR